jgi:N,N-dimethylformamidase
MYFHADALTDCGWEESVSLRIPPGMPSGVYGLEVAHPEGSDTIPFYVTPAPDGPRARVLFLAPTLTYQAYANHARGNYAGQLAERIAQWGAYPHNPDVVTQFGASTYNRHEDMAGISLSSRLRPILTMRPGYLTFPDPKGSGLRHFPADSHLTQWLREKGFDYDVITDEDLDDQGLDALRPYDVVLTGSHPEYHTRRMIEALVAYREGGGYLMYLGANGFYWKIARPAAAPHLLEIRRAEGGIRAWASEPGEYYHQLDGGYGGMWRRNGIAPQCTGGVGFAVQGGFEGIGYRRTPESYDPDVAWLFEGVEGETYGDFGLSGGGAAGFELDQVVPELGSPAYLKIVGISDGHGPSFRIAPEEILTWTIAASIPRKYEGVHAHMAVGVAEQGGGLFAAGSITFLGSLLHNGCNNNVSHIVENCLRHFLSISLAKRGADCAPL